MDSSTGPTSQPGSPAPDRPPTAGRPVPDFTKPPTDSVPASAVPMDTISVEDVPPAPTPRVPRVSPGAAAILGVVGTLLVMVVTGAFSSDDDSPAASPATSSTTPAVGGVTSTPSTLGGQIAAWSAAGGGIHIKNLAADAQAVAEASDAADLTALQAACIRMYRDVTTAQTYKRIPDLEADRHWSKALDLYRTSSTNCANAASMNDANLLRQSARETEQGAVEIRATSARIAAINAGR